MGVGREGFTGVGLYVPEERYAEASALAEELAESPVVDEGGSDVWPRAAGRAGKRQVASHSE